MRLKNNPERKITTLYLDVELLSELNKLMASLQTTRSAIVRMALQDFIADVKNRELRLVGSNTFVEGR
jgi:metal-responsive CopG/Arc/MetJ family transcriptional regulator